MFFLCLVFNQVAREAVLKFKPEMNITAHHANVKNPEFNVVLNGLDNVDARRHVNRLCLAAGVPLIESGSTGYLGQVRFSHKLTRFVICTFYIIIRGVVISFSSESIATGIGEYFMKSCWAIFRYEVQNTVLFFISLNAPNFPFTVHIVVCG